MAQRPTWLINFNFWCTISSWCIYTSTVTVNFAVDWVCRFGASDSGKQTIPKAVPEGATHTHANEGHSTLSFSAMAQHFLLVGSSMGAQTYTSLFHFTSTFFFLILITLQVIHIYEGKKILVMGWKPWRSLLSSSAIKFKLMCSFIYTNMLIIDIFLFFIFSI